MPAPRNAANARYDDPSRPPAPLDGFGSWEWVGDQWTGFWSWVADRVEEGQDNATDLLRDANDDLGKAVWVWPVVLGVTAVAAVFVLKRL